MVDQPMRDETTEAGKHRSISVWRAIIRRALADCSTVDYHDLSEAAVDNLALVAAQAVQMELEHG